MSWRLAQRGYEVISYAPIPDDCQRIHRGVQWRHISEADWSEDGLWVIYRKPEIIDNLQDQRAWLLCQDVDYPTLNEERAERFEKIIALTLAHGSILLASKPYLRDKIFISSNGIRMDVIREVEKEELERNFKRVMYASSPDRGLLETLQTFTLARRYDPELEIHTFYGFDNINKVVEDEKRRNHPEAIKTRKYRDKVLIESQKPNVFYHGRVPQTELYRQWLQTGVWLYQTNFFETSCITCMEAQALGAIPITRPYGALRNNIKYGIFIQGDAYSELNKARYMTELINVANSPEYQNSIREQMMYDARIQFNWERIVDQWDSVLEGWDKLIGTQYNFQFKHAEGKILNIGCHDDSTGFKEKLGAINIDRWSKCPYTVLDIKADVIADARDPLPFRDKFDSIIIGDLLEHLTDIDSIKVLQNAKAVLNDKGKIIVTVPDDQRIAGESKTDGYGFHKPVSKQSLERLIRQSNMRILSYQPIDYTFAEGHGIISQ
jgi:glycosyltransferase involved in cell wall biosynthesis